MDDIWSGPSSRQLFTSYLFLLSVLHQNFHSMQFSAPVQETNHSVQMKPLYDNDELHLQNTASVIVLPLALLSPLDAWYCVWLDAITTLDRWNVFVHISIHIRTRVRHNLNVNWKTSFSMVKREKNGDYPVLSIHPAWKMEIIQYFCALLHDSQIELEMFVPGILASADKLDNGAR